MKDRQRINLYELIGQIMLISSGGIFTTKDAIERIKDGASLIQIYSKLCLEVNRVNNGIVR